MNSDELKNAGFRPKKTRAKRPTGLIAGYNYVAIDPKTGRHVRKATAKEIATYKSSNVRSGTRVNRSFDHPVRVGNFLIDLYAGPGQSHTPGRFLK